MPQWSPIINPAGTEATILLIIIWEMPAVLRNLPVSPSQMGCAYVSHQRAFCTQAQVSRITCDGLRSHVPEPRENVPSSAKRQV